MATASPGKHVYSAEEVEGWDQRTTLKPPPYKNAMSRMLPGLNTGDPVFDVLPASMLACHGRPTAGNVPQLPDPEWVDWALVEKGQALWESLTGSSFLALGTSLLVGFSIARFGEVLYANGYAQDGNTALHRYVETAFAITDWFRFSLRDPTSRARQSLYTVRAMHAFARRRSHYLFNQELGEGVPLSQYDMAEVQLGFSGVCMQILEQHIALREIPLEEARAMTHMWRLLGYHLGIHDEFNVCNSLEDLQACLEDYMVFTPRRLNTARPCTAELQRTAIEGFGMWSGLGVEFWRGALDMAYATVKFEVPAARPKPLHLPGLDAIAKAMFRLQSVSLIQGFLCSIIVGMRERRLADPAYYSRMVKVSTFVSKIHDALIWRVVSAIFGTPLSLLLALFAIAFPTIAFPALAMQLRSRKALAIRG